jgi:hypothetical protein
MKKQIVIGDFGPSPIAPLFMRFLRPSYGALSPGVTDEIQTFLAFVVGKELRAQRLLVKCRQRNVNALWPIDASGEKVLGKANIGVRPAIRW